MIEFLAIVSPLLTMLIIIGAAHASMGQLVGRVQYKDSRKKTVTVGRPFYYERGGKYYHNDTNEELEMTKIEVEGSNITYTIMSKVNRK